MSVTSSVAPEQVASGILSAHDRCDRCGSQAYVSVILSGGQLHFCAHHYQQHELALEPIVVAVLDERHRLTAVS